MHYVCALKTLTKWVTSLKLICLASRQVIPHIKVAAASLAPFPRTAAVSQVTLHPPLSPVME